MVVWGEGNHGGNNSHEVVEYGVFAKNIAKISEVKSGELDDTTLLLGSDGSDFSRTFSFQAVVNKLKTIFSIKDHSHPWNAITGKPSTFDPSDHNHSWASITGKPTAFTPASHTHTPAEAGAAPIIHNHAWSAITDKPSSFTPSSHSHSWESITGKPSTFTPTSHTHTPAEAGAAPIIHNHAWSAITDKPSSFTPSSHSHSWASITGKPSTFAPSTHNHAWTEITGVPGNFKAGAGSKSVIFNDNSNLASGQFSFAEGWSTSASGRGAHASGFDTEAIGNESYAGGDGTQALGGCSFAIGAYTIADNAASFACGFHNKPQHTVGQALDEWEETDSLFYIGNGHGGTPSVRSNAFRVTRDGKVYGLSSFKASGADYAEFFEWADANLQGEDRVGRFVTMEGDKIKLAQPGDYILGIVSGNPCIVGNADEDWRGRWLRDDFDRFVREYLEFDREEVTVPEGKDESEFLGDPAIIKKGDKIYRVTTRVVDHETPFWRLKANPDYDPSQAYIERQDRPEWNAVGMLGVLAVWDDGTCQVNGFAQVAQGGSATAAEGYIPGMTYRVIERVADNIVKIIFR